MLEPSGPVQACNGIALPLPFYPCSLQSSGCFVQCFDKSVSKLDKLSLGFVTALGRDSLFVW